VFLRCYLVDFPLTLHKSSGRDVEASLRALGAAQTPSKAVDETIFELGAFVVRRFRQPMTTFVSFLFEHDKSSP